MSKGGEPTSTTRAGVAAKIVVAVVLIGGLLFWGAQWLHYRMNHVHVVDARVKTDMISVASRLPGWLFELEVMEGDRVSEGQILARVDSTDARLELAVVDARRNALASERAQLEAELNLARAVDENRVNRARKELESASVVIDQQRLALAKAEEDLGRLRGMPDKMISGQQLADARYAWERARVALRRGEAEQAAAEAALAEAQAQKLNQVVLQRQLEALDASLKKLDAEYRWYQLAVEDRLIRSPIDGVVARTFVDAGEYVQPGQNLLMIHARDDVWVEANVKETEVARVEPGQPVRIEVDAYPDTVFSGRVAHIGTAATSEFALLPSPNPSGNFTKTTQRIPLRITFDEPDKRLRPGMMVEVSIDVVD